MIWNWFKSNQSQEEISEIRTLVRDRHREKVKKQEDTKSKARKDALQLYESIIQAIKEELESDKEIAQDIFGNYHFSLEYRSSNPILEDEIYRKELGRSIKKYLKKERIYKSESDNATPIFLGAGTYKIKTEVKISA